MTDAAEVGPEKKKPPPPWALALGGLGAAVGWGVGQYVALLGLIPMGIALAVGLGASKVCGPRRRPMAAAFGVQIAHAAWFLTGAVMLGEFNEVRLDLLILVPGAIWLLAAPGIAPVVVLGVYQAIGIVFTVQAFVAAQPGTPTHKALLVHLIMRLVAVAAMAVGLVKVRRYDRAAAEEPEWVEQEPEWVEPDEWEEGAG